MKLVEFSLEQGNKYFGKIDGKRFLIGKRVPYAGGKGLMNIEGSASQRFDRSEFVKDHGFWADFIHPTAMAEGGLFHTLNTYDRAHFTFSFLQFAAHIPNGDFVLYMRALLNLPLAADYFPDLTVQNDRVCRIMDDGVVVLESDTSTSLLLDYLNPSVEEVEDTEVIQSAKFVHWAQNDAAHRAVQIEVGIGLFKEKMARYAVQYKLDGAIDSVCAVIADIRHQGRSKSGPILAALQNNNPLSALLKIGETRYPERISTLRREINLLLKDGTFGVRKYNLSKRDFV
jgi:hypothetical protein